MRKLTSLLTLLGLLLMTFSGLAAPNFRDLDKHWAQGYIRNWANQGLVAGYTEDSTFRPDNPITKAEFITLVNRVMGYTELKEADFPDVPQGSWFRGDVFKSLAIGYAEGYADGTFGPNQPLSREEAALMIYRIMKLENSEFENVLADFKDAAKIAPANQEALNAVVASGYLRGYPDQTIQPQWTTTRAEMIILLDRIAGEKYLAAGTYGPQDGLQTIKTNVTVSKPGITLRNMAIEGDLHLTEGIGAGDVTLENVTVKGRTLVAGGGRESVHVTGTSSLGNLEVHSANREVVRIVVDNTEILIDEIMLRTGAIIEFPQADGRQVATLTIAPQTGRQESPQQFTISGNLGQVVVQGNPDGAPINLQLTEDASIQELVVEEGAKGIQVTSAGSINQLNVAAPEATINITGGKIDEVNLETKTEINMTDGTVGTLKVEQEAAGSTITTSGDAKIDETDLAEDTTIIIDGKEVSDKPTPTPDSGPGPTTPSKTAVSAISVEPEQLEIAVAQTIDIITTVLPSNASDKRITWSSSNESVATVNDSGEVTGVSLGTAVITVTSVYNSNIKTDIEVTVGPALTVSGSILKGEQNPSIILSTTDDTFTSNATNSDNWQITLFTDSGPVRLIDIGVTDVEITLGEDNKSVTITFNGAINSLGTLLIAPKGEVFTAGISSGVVFCDIIEVSKLEKNYYAAGDILTFTISGLEPNEEVYVGMPIYTGQGGWPWASDEPVLTNMHQEGEGENIIRDWVGTTDGDGVLTVSGTVQDDLPNGILHITLPGYGIGIDNAIELQDAQGVGVRVGDPIINTTTNEGYTTIQAAIDAAIAGDTILVGPGTYEEQLEINKPLTLLGPNAEIVGYSEDRVDEAIVTYPEEIVDTSELSLLRVSSGNVTVKGFFFKNDKPNQEYKSQDEILFVGENSVFENNRVELHVYKKALKIIGAENIAESSVGGAVVKGNYIESLNGRTNAVYIQGIAATIENNTIISDGVAIQIQPYGNNIGGNVKNNNLSAYRYSIWHNFDMANSGEWIYDGNHLTTRKPDSLEVYQGSAAPPHQWRGIVIQTGSPDIEFKNNTIDGSNAFQDGIVNGEYWSDVIGIQFINGLKETSVFDIHDNIITDVTIGIQDGAGQADLDQILAKNDFPDEFIVLGNEIKMPEDGTIYNQNSGIIYNTIQAAIDDAVAGNNVIKVFPGDYGTDPIDIIQKAGVNITLEAVGEVVLKNQIKIDGAARYYGAEYLTIKGFTFDFSEAESNIITAEFIKAVEERNTKLVYAHNISIEDCEFMGNPNVNVVAVAAGTPGSHVNFSIKNCTGENLHSLGQLYVNGVTVENCTVDVSEGGLNLQNSTDIEINNLTVDGTEYGVRAGQTSGTVNTSNTMTISDSNLNAQYPIWLRGDAPGTVIITDSTLTASEDGEKIRNDAVGVNVLEDPTVYNEGLETYYMTIQEAITDLADGDTLTILSDELILAEKILFKNNGITIQGQTDADGKPKTMIKGAGNEVEQFRIEGYNVTVRDLIFDNIANGRAGGGNVRENVGVYFYYPNDVWQEDRVNKLINCESINTYWAIFSGVKMNFEMEGCTFTKTGTDGGVFMDRPANVVINDSSFTGDDNCYALHVNNGVVDGKFVVNNSSFAGVVAVAGDVGNETGTGNEVYTFTGCNFNTIGGGELGGWYSSWYSIGTKFVECTFDSGFEGIWANGYMGSFVYVDSSCLWKGNPIDSGFFGSVKDDLAGFNVTLNEAGEIIGGIFVNDPTAKLADGYVANMSDGTWVVSMENSQTLELTANFIAEEEPAEEEGPDFTPINTAIQEAIAAKGGITVSEDGTDVPAGTYWVTQEDMDALDAAIAEAEAAKESAETQQDVAEAVEALEAAVSTFNDAKREAIDAEEIEEPVYSEEPAQGEE